MMTRSKTKILAGEAESGVQDGYFFVDDKDVLVWFDALKQDWYAECDKKFCSARMRVIIENHSEFEGWSKACKCGSGLPSHKCDECDDNF
jgi:hypothetical protein